MLLINKIGIFILKQIIDIKKYGFEELLKKCIKLIRIIAQFPFYLIAIFLLVIIKLISPWILIRITRAPSFNYGNFAADLALYCCKKKLNIDQLTQKHFDLFYIHPNEKHYNKQLSKMWRRELNFFSGYILHPINNIGSFLPSWKNNTIGLFTNKLERDVDNLIEKYQPLKFSPEEEVYGKKLLTKFGLKNDDKFVCLAVRDSAYQFIKMSSKTRDWSYQNYRDENIDDFILAVEELTMKGYFVFRMGVVQNKPLNSKNKKIIDYAFSNLRNDFMDVYLGSKCSFCISTGLGFDQVPYIFRKPIGLLGLPVGDLRTFSDKFLLLTKHHILKNKKRKLSLSEIFSYGVAFAYDKKIFEQKGIELLNYTPNEIKDFVLEMVNNLDSKNKYNDEDEKLQNTLRTTFVSSFKKLNYQKAVKKPFYKIQGKFRARFHDKFLRENRYWLQ